MYDGSEATFECSRSLDGSFVIAVVGDQILITREEQPFRGLFTGLPGGGFDHVDEDPLDCARRELREETGYESDEWELFLVSDGSSANIVYTYFYIARNARKVGAIQPDGGERIEIDFVDFDQFLLLAEQTPTFANFTLAREMLLARIYPDRYETLRARIFRSRN